MKRRLFAGLCLLLAAAFLALGVWQVQRRAWKHALVARVDARLHAAPRAMPRRIVSGEAAAYTRVRLTGVFLHDRETLVQAVTARGAGWWVMTPLATADGIVLVNRGFVPPERRAPAMRAAGQVRGAATVTGLLRASEPGGGFLRANAPAENRWYSRDVTAIAAARGLCPAARTGARCDRPGTGVRGAMVLPVFVDADGAPNPGGYPVGGLTVVALRDAHLVYALTWFGLAVLALAGALIVVRRRGS